jgi:hypothetical protein
MAVLAHFQKRFFNRALNEDKAEYGCDDKETKVHMGREYLINCSGGNYKIRNLISKLT